jgi:tRNA 2-thiouridine synthesizing protein A
MEDEKLLMEPLVKQLSVGLKREESASKSPLIAIRLDEQTTLAKSLVMSRHSFDVELDVRQLACPLPILRAKRSLSAMSSGQVIRIVATDPGAMNDFEVFCRQTGNELVSSLDEGGEYVFLIRRR